MKVAKFKAASMREALAQVKRELGEDAMVLSTRDLRRGSSAGGVEITAAAGHVDGPSEPEIRPGLSPMGGRAAAAYGGSSHSSSGLAESDVERIMAPLRSELRALRSLVKATGDSGPLRQDLAELKRSICDLADRSVSTISAVGSSATGTLPLDHVARTARLTAPSASRVVALVGPTGAGKTTTIAKLAARTALLERRRVGLITLDDYRVGGEEQLRIFADLIPAPLHLAVNRPQLKAAIDALADCDQIYIDTSGRSPRDRQAHIDLGKTLADVPGLETHLVVPAPSSPAYIDALVGRTRSAFSIDRLLFTKIDEADDLSELVRAPARVVLPVAYITMGQAVPEDLEDASGAALLNLATHRVERDARAA